MRNVHVWFRVCVLVTVGLGAVLAVAGWINATDGGDGTAAIVVGVTLALFVIMLIVDLVLWKTARAIRIARRPDQRIAAWQVSADTWEAYRTLDAARVAETPTYFRVFKPRKATAQHIEVLAARSGILIDGVFAGLEPRGLGAMTGLQWLSGHPECIEFSMLVPVGGPNNVMRTIPGLFRVPVEPAQREAAITAFDYYRDLRETGELSNPSGHRLLVKISLWLGVALLVVGLGALALASQGNQSTPVAIAALLGLMGGAGALIVAGVVWLIMLKK